NGTSRSGGTRRPPRNRSPRRSSGAARDPCRHPSPRRAPTTGTRARPPPRRELARGELLQDLLGEVQVAHVALLRRPHVELDAEVAQDAPLLLDDPRHG